MQYAYKCSWNSGPFTLRFIIVSEWAKQTEAITPSLVTSSSCPVSDWEASLHTAHSVCGVATGWGISASNSTLYDIYPLVSVLSCVSQEYILSLYRSHLVTKTGFVVDNIGFWESSLCQIHFPVDIFDALNGLELHHNNLRKSLCSQFEINIFADIHIIMLMLVPLMQPYLFKTTIGK